MRRPKGTIFWSLGAAVFAILFAGVLELSRRTAYVWSILEADAAPGGLRMKNLVRGICEIISGDPKMVCAGLAAGALIGALTVVLAVLVRAYWNIRIGKRCIMISALAVAVAVDLLILGWTTAQALAQSRRYHEAYEQVAPVRLLMEEEKRICHAGGSVTGADGKKYKYTNSLEAFRLSLERGARLVELDFRISTDGALVCIHKWKKDFIREDGTRSEEAVSLEEFRKGKIRGSFTPMTMEDVAKAMEEHPELYIVVDLKGDDFFRGYRILAQEYPELMARMIPQFYHASQFDDLYSLGYRAMIYTLYRTSEWERSEAVLNSFAMRQVLAGITMGNYRVKDGGVFLRQVLKTREPVYVHTVDDPDRAHELFEMGVSAIYTNEYDAW